MRGNHSNHDSRSLANVDSPLLTFTFFFLYCDKLLNRHIGFRKKTGVCLMYLTLAAPDPRAVGIKRKRGQGSEAVLVDIGIPKPSV